jgi:hypothetical protein
MKTLQYAAASLQRMVFVAEYIFDTQYHTCQAACFAPADLFIYLPGTMKGFFIKNIQKDMQVLLTLNVVQVMAHHFLTGDAAIQKRLSDTRERSEIFQGGIICW